MQAYQKTFCKVAVLGAGVMGAQIAAHLTNANVDTLLFDLSSKGDPNAIIKKSLHQLIKLKPSPFSILEKAKYIQPANYDNDLARLAECDLVIEAIAERFELKQSLYQKITKHLKPGAVLVSNTSGLSINQLSDVLPPELQGRFCGVHFFNPPRYMHLVEIIPSDKTDSGLLTRLESFLVSSLGKGVVYAKDTPNFIANRIGVFAFLSTLHHAEHFGIDFEIVDALTGALIGRPKSATYRTMDVVGLDTMSHVIATMEKNLPNDPWCNLFKTPEWLSGLIQRGALGQKTKCGIYKKQGAELLVWDLATSKYRVADRKPQQEILDILKIKDPAERFKTLYQHQHPQAQFLWACFRDLFHYCAVTLNQIADTTRDLDLAIRWGFGWQQGPFETWQTIGWETVTTWINQDITAKKALNDKTFPDWIYSAKQAYSNGQAYAPSVNQYIPRSPLPLYQRQYFPDPVLTETFNRGETLYENDGVRLWRLDDDCGILSFKNKVNAIGDDVLDGILEAVRVAEDKCVGLVIWQHQLNIFSVGANLKQFSPIFEKQDHKALDAAVYKFQRAALALRDSVIPVVAAVRGQALGGGCELLMHCDRVVASLESYIGLVEIGVGLLPAGGGCKEFARRAYENTINADPFQILQHNFKTIAMAEVSSSAEDAKGKGFLRPADLIIFNPHEVLYVAKKQAIAMAEAGYRPPLKPIINVVGKPGIATLQMQLINLREGHFITEYEYFIGTKIAEVLCGGRIEQGSEVNEEWFLRLEREAFVELACDKRTQQRVKHLLETGKPLRN